VAVLDYGEALKLGRENCKLWSKREIWVRTKSVAIAAVVTDPPSRKSQTMKSKEWLRRRGTYKGGVTAPLPLSIVRLSSALLDERRSFGTGFTDEVHPCEARFGLGKDIFTCLSGDVLLFTSNFKRF